MAKGFKSGGRDWEIGQSGNPKGRPVGYMDELREVKRLKKVYRLEFEKKLQIYMQKDLVELRNIMSSLQSALKFENRNCDRSDLVPALDMIIIKVIMSAFEKGDVAKLNYLTEQAFGKITDDDVDSDKPKVLQLKYNLDDSTDDAIEIKKPKTVRRIGGAIKNGKEN